MDDNDDAVENSNDWIPFIYYKCKTPKMVALIEIKCYSQSLPGYDNNRALDCVHQMNSIECILQLNLYYLNFTNSVIHLMYCIKLFVLLYFCEWLLWFCFFNQNLVSYSIFALNIKKWRVKKLDVRITRAIKIKQIK